jgi:hypothetical protein
MPEITKFEVEQYIKYYLNRYKKAKYNFTAPSYASEDIHLLANAANKFPELVVL